MSYGIYTGVNGVARGVKKLYTGISGEVPGNWISLTTPFYSNPITNYFSVWNDSYYFSANSRYTWEATNKGVQSSIATTSLTANSRIFVKFSYSVSSEKNYDKLIITAPNYSITISGIQGGTTPPLLLEAGQQIIIKYSKDSSVNSNVDKAAFGDIFVATPVNNGSVAREVIKTYTGVNGVARLTYPGKVIATYSTDLGTQTNPVAELIKGNNNSFRMHVAGTCPANIGTSGVRTAVYVNVPLENSDLGGSGKLTYSFFGDYPGNHFYSDFAIIDTWYNNQTDTIYFNLPTNTNTLSIWLNLGTQGTYDFDCVVSDFMVNGKQVVLA